MSTETVISVEHLSKEYRLGAINHGLLYRDLQSWWARLRGIPDPNAVIGAAHTRYMGAHRFRALDDISFDVSRGEALAIIGRNGAGKSTLLKILSRITIPSTGIARLKGRVASLLEVGTGFHPELTGRENVFLNGAILGMTRAEIRRRFDEIVSFAEISEFIDTPVKRYSSGMYVRLAFSVAAHLEAEILVVDEVLAVGDFQFQKKCLGKMGEVPRQGRTVLFVSHNLGAVAQLCERVIFLHEGTIRDDGPATRVVERYLRESHSLSPAVDFPENSDLKAQVLRVELENTTRPGTNVFEVGERVGVRISYRTRQRLRGVHVACILTDATGYHVFSTADTDAVPALLGQTREPGVRRVRVELPVEHLNSGVYHVGVGIGHPGTAVLDRRDCVSFTIQDSSFGSLKEGGRRQGLLLLNVPWQEVDGA